jgi:tRNA (cytosine38-C5)-methyltransferase
VNELSGYLDADGHTGQSHPNTVPDRVLVKWGKLFDIVLPSSRRSCCFTRGCVSLRPLVQAVLTCLCRQGTPNWLNEQDPSCK